MKIFWGSSNFIAKAHTVVIGNFDGMHKGHVDLFRSAKQLKGDDDLGVITFFPHTDEVVRSRDENFYLTTYDEKIEIFEELGVDTVFFIDFNTHVSNYSPEQFLDHLRGFVNIKKLFAGENFRFGKQGGGNISFLKKYFKKYNVDVHSGKLLKIANTPISSTLIRNCIFDGDLVEAEKFLGRPYLICGTVMHGKNEGKRIGYPTANLLVEYKVIPKCGVYCGTSYFNDKKFFSLIYIGKDAKPGESENIIEVWMKDFKGDIYGKQLCVHIEKFIRNIKIFNTKEQLKKAIDEDLQKSATYL